MGAKAWFVSYCNGDPKGILAGNPKLDRAASLALVERLLPGVNLQEREDVDLYGLNPTINEVVVGDYGDLKIVAHLDLCMDHLSRIDPRWYAPELGSNIYIHATRSVVDWCAFALWQEGELVRALSVSPDDGVIEDIGAKLSFETPYWDGSLALDDDDETYPLLFHSLDLSESALLANLGFQFEGHPDSWVCDPMAIPIMRFQTSRKAWWKFW